MSRRVAVTALLAGVWLALWAGAAWADDCSSPTDCSNTAWTVGGGAAIAATIIAAAAAGGWLGNGNGTAVEDRPQLAPECRELAPLGRRIDADVRRLAALAGARQGALRRAQVAEVQAEFAVEGLRTALARAGVFGRGGTATTWEGVLVDSAGIHQAHLTTTRAAMVARWERVGLTLRPHPGALGAGLGITSVLLNAAGQVANATRDEALRLAGIFEQLAAQKRAEVARWEAQADEWGRDLDEGLERLRPDAERYRRTLLEHGCPAPALSVETLIDRLRNPPPADVTLPTATLPGTLLEQPGDFSAFQRQRREQAEQPLGCEGYDGELAAYERDLRDQADEQRWEKELRRWATRRAQLEELWWALRETRKVLDVLLHAETLNRRDAGAAAGLATVASMVPGIGWAGAAGFGIMSILVSLAGQYRYTVEDAKLLAQGRLAVHESRIRYRIGQAEAELARLRSLHTQRRLRREDAYARLMDTWRHCDPDWKKAGTDRPMPQQPPWSSDLGPGWRQLADPFTPFPRLPAGTPPDSAAVQAVAAQIKARLEEVETWR